MDWAAFGIGLIIGGLVVGLLLVVLFLRVWLSFLKEFWRNF